MADNLTARVTVRVSRETLNQWTAAARATGRKLPEFLRDAGDAEVEYSEQAAALRERLRERRAKG